MTSSALKGVAHLNPAVTIATVVQHTYYDTNGWFLLPAFLLGQTVGAILGQVIINIFYWKHIKDTIVEAPNLVLAMHSTGPQHRNPFLNFFSEFIGTFILIAGILAIGQFPATFALGSWAPLFVALIVFGIGLSLGGTTGYAINPIRDLAPRIVHFVMPLKGKAKSDWNYAWIPVAAPLTAAAVCSAIFLVI